MSKLNPLNRSERHIKRVEPELETDTFGPDEQKKIVEMVMQDAKSNQKVMDDALEKAKLDLQHYENEKPSVLENLDKKGWQSDKNLGLCPAVCDTYQATLLSTCYNPDTIHYKATEQNDVDNKDNLQKFTKWAIGPNEGNIEPEVDDYIHNRITFGFSIFHIWWKVWYDWVDKRVPNKTGGFTIKTEKMRFERGVMENIANPLQDMLLPKFGKNVQDLKQFVHLRRMSGSDLLDYGKRGIFVNVDQKMVDKIKDACVEKLKETLTDEKASQLGIADISDTEVSAFPLALNAWYGWYKKGKRRERYRFIVEPVTETFLSGKPLRKITRSGKYPFVGSAFIRRPGFILGKSLPRLIAPIVNAFNNVFNQKSDFQYVENCPFGFHNPDEGYTSQVYDLEPGVSYPVDGKPSESVYFPNLSRSMAWAEQDIRILFEVLEKLTGAASYFLSSERQSSATATRDMLVTERSETRFGLWVSRLTRDINEAITMYINMYQDWAPPKLGERVLGEDGKKIFKNLSIDTLRGNYDAYMNPNLIAGSKTLEKQVKLWGLENLSQTVWVDPRVNPKGNWNITAEAAKAMGYEDVERYLGPEPKAEPGSSDDIKNEWMRFMQGEEFDPPEGISPAVVEHYAGHLKQKEEQYSDLDEEYKPNFDAHFFKTMVNYASFIRQIQAERSADALAMRMVQEKEAGIKEPDIQ